jgi:hypothetical protein
MDLLTSVRKAGSLERLAELEVADAVLFAQRQQALCDAEDVCRAQPASEHALEFLALDVALACGIAQSTATHRLASARHLVSDLPGTFALLLAGELRVGQGLVLMEETRALSAEVCALVEQSVLGKLEGLSTGDTRRLVKRTVVRVDAEASEQRREAQHRERRAFVSPKPDGRAFVGVDGSAEQALGFWEHLTMLAKVTFGADDPRTLDQQRADLALSLPGFALASRSGHGPSLRGYLGLAEENPAQPCSGSAALTPKQQRRLQAVILVPVETALGMSDEPADLVGYGPISGPHARDLLVAAELRQACTDLTTGRLVALSDTVVRPPRETGHRWGSAHYPQQGEQVYEADLPQRNHGRGDLGPVALRRDRTEPLQRWVDALPRPLRPPSPLGPARSTRSAGPSGPPEPSVPPAPPGPPFLLLDALLQMTTHALPLEDRVEPRHDPSRWLTDFVVLRDTRCIGPGCSLPARACDLDHWQPYPAGPTSAANLGPASRRCHNAKTYGGWILTPHPDGSITWTTPQGQSHTRPSRTTGADLSRLHAPAKHIPPHQRAA